MWKTVYKQWLHEWSYTNCIHFHVGEFTKKSVKQQIKQQPRIIQQDHKLHKKMSKETILPDTEAVILLYFSENYFYVRMPHKGSTGKLIRRLSTLL
jgi:hypothetical protein